MPIADMLINDASGHKVISFLDGNAGYNQIFMAGEDVQDNFLLPWFSWFIRVDSDDIQVKKCWRHIPKGYEFDFS